jgi:RNA polymerase sigma factor (sigma-70 family)
MQHKTDSELISIYRDNQDSHIGQEAFTTLHNRHYAKAVSVIQSKLRDHQAAEDVVQKGLMAIADHCGEFDSTRSEFTTWFHFILDRLTKNMARDLKRQVMITNFVTPESLVVETPEVGLEVELDELRGSFWEFVNSLDGARRDAVCAIYVSKMTYQEAENALGVLKVTVKKRVASVRAGLRRALGGEMPECANFSLERREKPRHARQRLAA